MVEGYLVSADQAEVHSTVLHPVNSRQYADMRVGHDALVAAAAGDSLTLADWEVVDNIAAAKPVQAVRTLQTSYVEKAAAVGIAVRLESEDLKC